MAPKRARVNIKTSDIARASLPQFGVTCRLAKAEWMSFGLRYRVYSCPRNRPESVQAHSGHRKG